MLKTLKLLLPALMPSWRFFDVIAPSPRIEFSLLKTAEDSSAKWQEFRPRVEKLSFGCMLKYMFWNSRWNESLFLVSCAERLMQNPTEHSYQEILKRIQADLELDGRGMKAPPYLQFRLVFLSRNGSVLETHISFTSSVHSFVEGREL